MNCIDFQKQFEVGSKLNDLAKTHLDKCEHCRAFEQKEIILTQMIQSLPKVEAPKDFGFRLNSYIAKTEKVKRPLPAIWQTLRFTLPLAAAVLIIGFIVFNSNLFNSQSENQTAIAKDSKPEIKENFEKDLPKENNDLQDSIVAESEEINLEDKPIEPIIKTEKNNKLIFKESIKAKQPVNKTKSVKKVDKLVEEDFSRSENFASIQPPVLLPQNNSADGEKSETDFVDRRKHLLEIGISTENKSWRVNAVKKESVAEKAGVQIGDVIVEINKIPVSAQIPQSESVKTTSLKVLRDKNIVNINLVN